MSRYPATTLLVLFCFSFISLAWSGDVALHGHNLPWGKGIEEFSNLVLIKTVGGISFYHNPDPSTDYDLTPGIKSSRIAYAFKNDKLFARIDEIDTVDDFIKILDQMVELFGEPKEKMEITNVFESFSRSPADINRSSNPGSGLSSQQPDWLGSRTGFEPRIGRRCP